MRQEEERGRSNGMGYERQVQMRCKNGRVAPGGRRMSTSSGDKSGVVA